MGHISHEPSMEEILSSIKRIIAEDGDAPAPRAKRTATRPQAVPPVELVDDGEETEDDAEVLELTDAVEQASEQEAEIDEHDLPVLPPAPKPAVIEEDLVSAAVASASRQSLTTLSRLIVKPDEGAENTLEGLVREMLRPMLKSWLDANLPDLVEAMVSKEIARITGQTL